MRVHYVVLYSVLVTHSLAQINLSSILSDAASIFTSLTSALADTTQTTSSSSQTTSSSLTSTTSAAASSTFSTSSTRASAASTPTNSAAAESSASSASAAAASATHSSKSGGGGSSNTLPIVLGCTLGALALAAFIGLCFLCRRRRSRKSRAAAKNRSHSPSDDDSDIWEREKHQRNSFKGPTERTKTLGVTNTNSNAPLTSRLSHDHQYSGYGPYPDHNMYGENPSKPNYYNTNGHPEDNDLASSSVHPYSPDHVQSYGQNGEDINHGHNERDALAAGVGGAALGALAIHATDKHEARRSGSRSRKVHGTDEVYSEDEHNALPQADMVSSNRRSDDVSRAGAKEPWPFMGAQGRESMESSRSRPRSMSRGRNQFANPEQNYSERHSMPSGAALAGVATAGGLAGAAVAHGTGSRSPHRKGILKNTKSHLANQSTSPENNVSGPHELESYDVPPPKRTSRNRRHSPLGHAAPAAAVLANHSPDRSRRKSWSNNSSPPEVATSLPHESSQDSDIPSVPSRSPRRNSVHSNARYSMDNGGTVELPGHEDLRHTIATRDPVSPTVGPHHGPVDNDGVVSPISPTNSQPGTWSKAQAEELGMMPIDANTKSSSQESTVVESSPLNSNSISRQNSKGQSSGLVTAIQRIFNSPKQSWYAEDTASSNYPPRRSFGDRTMPMTENFYEDNRQISSVPHRKPAPTTTMTHENGYSEMSQPNTMPGSWENDTSSLQQSQPQRSGDSARSVPLTGSRFYARVNSNEDINVPPVPTPAATPNANLQNTSRQRAATRPGYGIGSGDPFDLARVRTDSSMTGISLLNYVEPEKHNTANTNNMATTSPRPARKSTSSSTDYPQPTLAELRQQVQEEDRQRLSGIMGGTGRRSFGNTSRKSGEGQRYGDDREFFGSLIPGVDGVDHVYGHGGQGQGYASGNGRGNGGFGMAY